MKPPLARRSAPRSRQKHMPRRIATYTASDWLRLRPLTQGYKTWLWDRIDRRHAAAPARPAPSTEPCAEAAFRQEPGRVDRVQLALDHPLAVALRRPLPRECGLSGRRQLHRSQAARGQSKSCAPRPASPISQLPANPYRRRAMPAARMGWRSTGSIATSSVALRPAAWGFFDHDLFPTRPFDPLRRLRGQPFYGDLDSRPGGRYLWPGYCLFSPMPTAMCCSISARIGSSASIPAA